MILHPTHSTPLRFVSERPSRWPVVRGVLLFALGVIAAIALGGYAATMEMHANAATMEVAR